MFALGKFKLSMLIYMIHLHNMILIFKVIQFMKCEINILSTQWTIKLTQSTDELVIKKFNLHLII